MQFRRNSVKVTKVIESSHNSLPLAFGFPDITTEDLQLLKPTYWNSLLDDDPAQAAMQMFWHSYVLEANGKRFLIDTCCGNDKVRPMEFFNRLDTPYLANLAAAGYRPEDIDYVLCTHLHHDHVGWNTKLENGKWVPTFPNAKYVFTSADYAYFSRYAGHDAMQNPAFQDSILPIVEHGMAELVDTNHMIEHEIGSEVRLEGVPGHTPGSCVIHAGDPKVSDAIFTGDLFHHPLEVINPNSHFAADEDSARGTESRRAFLSRVADTASTLFPAHFFAGTVHAWGDRFRYDLINGNGGEVDYYRFI
jgi:glyoxylase-like metal-dependent hydrolase (beta-lactamase superfamily II)